MKKAVITVLVLLMLSGAAGCGTKQSNTGTIAVSGGAASVPGTWQTASIAYLDDGSMVPAYYVRFTDSDILYGHMKEGEFIIDHSDKISLLEKSAAGGFKIQAAASNGVEYTYQTCADDNSIMEYYETWNENDFPEMYRGGASLSRNN